MHRSAATFRLKSLALCTAAHRRIRLSQQAPWHPLHCPQALSWTPVPDQFCTSKNHITESQVYSLQPQGQP